MRARAEIKPRHIAFAISLRRALAGFHLRLKEGQVSSWILGLVVTVFSWPFFPGELGVGLDPSWAAGLAMATSSGRDFGEEIVFTYGPLGFLRTSPIIHVWLSSLAWFYQATVLLLVAVGIVELLRRSLGPWGAMLMTLLALVLFNTGVADLALVLAVVISMLALRTASPSRARYLLVLGGGVFTGIELLTKVSSGPAIALILLLGMVGSRAGARQIVGFGIVVTFTCLGLWLVTGQTVSAITMYFVGALEISSGYREAMTASAAEELPISYAISLVSIAALITVSTYFGDFSSRRERWSATLLVAIAVVVLVKWATWRYGLAHLTAALSTMVLVALAIPRKARFRLEVTSLMLTLMFGSFYLISSQPNNPYTFRPSVDIVSKARAFVTSGRTAIDPRRRVELIKSGRSNLRKTYDLSRRVIMALRGQRVAVQPWEASVVWAYRLPWEPLPVFQSYSAYTSELDRLNADAVSEPDGPTRILRPIMKGAVPKAGLPWGPTFFDRVPAWDPPAQQRAIYCNFVPQTRDTNWEVLRRVKPRCGPLQKLSSVSAHFNQTVRIPVSGPDALTVLRLRGAQVQGLEKLESLLIHADSREVVINGQRDQRYRLVPGTAGDGMMMWNGKRNASRRISSEIPRVKTLEVEGRDGQLRFDFYRMKVGMVPLSSLD